MIKSLLRSFARRSIRQVQLECVCVGVKELVGQAERQPLALPSLSPVLFCSSCSCSCACSISVCCAQSVCLRSTCVSSLPTCPTFLPTTRPHLNAPPSFCSLVNAHWHRRGQLCCRIITSHAKGCWPSPNGARAGAVCGLVCMCMCLSERRRGRGTEI